MGIICLASTFGILNKGRSYNGRLDKTLLREHILPFIEKLFPFQECN